MANRTKESIERYTDTLTDQELFSACNKVWYKLREYCAGGLTFGMDWTTIRICYPDLAACYWYMIRAYQSRTSI